MSNKILILSGVKAKKAFLEGERNPAVLMDLGFCREMDFPGPEAKEAFVTGVKMGSRIVDPVLFDLTKAVLLRDS